MTWGELCRFSIHDFMTWEQLFRFRISILMTWGKWCSFSFSIPDLMTQGQFCKFSMPGLMTQGEALQLSFLYTWLFQMGQLIYFQYTWPQCIGGWGSCVDFFQYIWPYGMGVDMLFHFQNTWPNDMRGCCEDSFSAYLDLWNGGGYEDLLGLMTWEQLGRLSLVYLAFCLMGVGVWIASQSSEVQDVAFYRWVGLQFITLWSLQ